MYDPALGRFMQRDPTGEGNSLNLYPYCGNDPVNYVDPMGTDRVEAHWNDKENRFDVYTVREHYDDSNTGLAGGFDGMAVPNWVKVGEDAPVLIGHIDNQTGLVSMFGGLTTMSEVVKEAHRNGTWSTGNNVVGSSETYDHFNPEWRNTHLYYPNGDVTGLRGAVFDLYYKAFLEQMTNARSSAQRVTAQDELDTRLNDVYEGTDLAADLVIQAAIFYLTAPLDLAQSVRALRLADSVDFGKLSAKLLERKDIRNLMSRMSEYHMALDEVAQVQRTTAILATDGPTIIGSGVRDLIPAQRSLVQAGEVLSKLPGEHGEITVLTEAKRLGLTPRILIATRDFCPDCLAALRNSGATLIGKRVAIWR